MAQAPNPPKHEAFGHSDYYTGTKQQLIDAGLASDGQFPGDPGRNKHTCAFDAHGQPRVNGGPKVAPVKIARRGRSTFVVTIRRDRSAVAAGAGSHLTTRPADGALPCPGVPSAASFNLAHAEVVSRAAQHLAQRDQIDGESDSDRFARETAVLLFTLVHYVVGESLRHPLFALSAESQERAMELAQELRSIVESAEVVDARPLQSAAARTIASARQSARPPRQPRHKPWQPARAGASESARLAVDFIRRAGRLER